MVAIPAFVVEYFLLGKTRRDAIERYTQDGSIVSDVWLAFATDPARPQRVLVAPSAGSNTAALGYALHKGISGYRRSHPELAQPRESPGVSPLENFVAVTLYLDELLRIVLPMTSWWHRKSLSLLQRKAFRSGRLLDEMLEQAILIKLGIDELGVMNLRRDIKATEDVNAGSAFPDRRVLEAAPLAALIGVFRAAELMPEFLDDVHAINPHTGDGVARFNEWVVRHARDIAHRAREELSRPFESALKPLQRRLQNQLPEQQGLEPEEPPELIQRVFLDRRAGLADTEALSTIKADAASRVFDIACRNITWAVIDAGIATTHPAFLDHGARDRRGNLIVPTPSRIRATYDFTVIERIRNFDLILNPAGSPERAQAIAEVVEQLEKLPGRAATAEFRQLATTNLELIARQLDQPLPPDWNLIEPLIRLSGDDGARLVSDHGTHVAGILAGDWRAKPATPDARGEVLLRGVCPDISLYDLRVIHETSRDSTEFALLAALEFVQFVNARAAGNGPIVHGVNISLSIPHDVRNYGCGATPVCAACDRLSGSGVVVVAAAGNRGWNEQEIGFGNFVFCSITDPGNAREVITVGSTHRLKPHTYGVSYFSSRGPTGDGRIKPDLVAPGEKIRGPVRGEADDELDGTSMAAPFVSGAAAMLLARHGELIGNPARVKSVLCGSATDLGREKYFQGHGLVDVLRALQSV